MGPHSRSARHSSVGILLVLACALTCHAAGNASGQRPPHSVGRDASQVVHGWPVLPEGRLLGSVAGCAVDSHDDVFVFHRNERAWPANDELTTVPIRGPTVSAFDSRTGRVRMEWGAGIFAMPHGLSIDRNDHVWLTDVALQQVFEFTHDGRLLRTLGERGVSGNDAGHFNRPTQVAGAPDGSFYVSDGYRNTRVMKFSASGQFLFQWGTPGSGPGQFDLPHGVALGSDGRVYVSDRGNSRVQIFDEHGRFLREWKDPRIGRPYDLALAADGTAVIADGGDQPETPPDRSALVRVGPDGEVIERIGRWGNYDGQLALAHCVAIARDGALYVGDITGGRIQKFIAKRR